MNDGVHPGGASASTAAAPAPAPPAGSEVERLTLARIDHSCRLPVLWFIVSGVCWLLLGSMLALVASAKLHTPDMMTRWSWATFGRVRPAHLNAMIYGWGAMAGIGVILWLQARLSRVPLAFPRLLTAVAVAWNLA
ncbi:MAG: cbb3-type cytochrome c oxidase subunit I, partial [bacterium]|nr:cbb3-type cytochrome c oxidase subunit I [bacterium]